MGASSFFRFEYFNQIAKAPRRPRITTAAIPTPRPAFAPMLKPEDAPEGTGALPDAEDAELVFALEGVELVELVEVDVELVEDVEVDEVVAGTTFLAVMLK
jgi:hypothetical protein